MNRKKQSLVSGIILILFAVSFISFGIIFSKNHETKLKNCTEQVIAEVIEDIETTSTERVSNYKHKNKHYKTVTYYTPVFEFEYDGKNYRAEGRREKYSASFNIGENVELKINPLNPYELYEVGDDSYNSSLKAIMILAGFFLIFGIYMLIKSK